MPTDEHSIQKAIITYLRTQLRGRALVFHPMNNPRNAIQGRRMKGQGMMAGVADICIVTKGSVAAFMEVKKERGKLSKVQQSFRDDCEALDIDYAVVRSVDDARETLEDWGLI